MLTEKLEQRRMLAGDFGLEAIGPRALFAQVSAEGESPLGEAAETIDAAVQYGSDTVDSFAMGLRQAVDEISRVVAAINSAPALAAEIPYLGSLVPESIAGSTLIDTSTVQSLFSLADRFETNIAEPLRTFLESHPTATATQLVNQFDFLESVSGLTAGQQGVKLNFDLQEQIESTIAALLEPILSRADSLLDAVDSDALATALPFNLSLEDFSFEVVRNAVEEVSIKIPDVVLRIADEANIPIDFAAQSGFLSGGVTGGSIRADLGLRLGTSDLFGGEISLDDLRGFSLSDEFSGLNTQVIGSGIEVRLPFDFEMAGFDTGGFLPVFTLRDTNPFDSDLPELELEVPRGADYDAGAITGFGSIDATSILSTLEELGTVFGAWEAGDVLNYPLPLGDDVSLSEVAGFADAYAGGVLQFLKTGDGLPAFGSIQELQELIPSLSGGVGDFITYDAENQTITIDVALAWNPEDLVRQANIDVLAGSEDSPIASISMTPGVSGTDNRLTISRDLSLDFEIQIGLKSETREIIDVISERFDPTGDFVRDAPLWTPMITILDRLGLTHLANEEQMLNVTLHDGRIVSANMGTIDPWVTIGEWLERGTVVDDNNGEVLMTLEYEPTVLVGMPYEDLNNRFVVVDHTVGADRVEIEIEYRDSEDSDFGFFDSTPIRDADVPWATTLGEARRFVVEAAADHMESVFASVPGYDTFTISVGYRDPDPAGSNPLASAGPTAFAVGQTFNNGLNNTTYFANLANYLNGGPVMIDGELQSGPVVNATFLSDINWDHDVSGPSDLGRYGLFKVATHEILHGLGFASNIVKEGGYYATGWHSIFDSFLVRGDGTPIQSLGQAERAASLISEDLFFAGPNASDANPIAAGPVRIFAPDQYNPGSSTSHVDTSTFARYGETMTHEIGEYLVAPIGVTALSVGFMQDLGYNKPTIATTEVTSTDGVWEKIFEPANPSFGIPTSVPLNLTHGLFDSDQELADFFSVDIEGLEEDSRDLTLSLSDGSTHRIDLGPISEMSIQQLSASLRIFDDGEWKSHAHFENNQLVITDLTDPQPGNDFKLEWRGNGSELIREFVRPATAAAGANQLTIGDIRSALPTSPDSPFDLNASILSLASTESSPVWAGSVSTATVQLSSGESFNVSTEVIDASTSLADVLGTLSVGEIDEDVKSFAALPIRDDRVLIHDKTFEAGGTGFRITDTTVGGGVFAWLLGDGAVIDVDQNGFISGRSLHSATQDDIGSQPPAVYVDVDVDVPGWTSMLVIADRLGLQNQTITDQSISFRVRNGDLIRLSLPGDIDRYTIDEAIASLRSVNEFGETVAELIVRDGRWQILDHTQGSASLALSSATSLFRHMFADRITSPDDDRIIGNPVADTVVRRLAGDVSLETFSPTGLVTVTSYDALLMQDVDEIYSNSQRAAARYQPDAAPLQITLRDGTTHQVAFGNLPDTTLLDALNELTLRRDGQRILEAWFENDAIQLRDLTTSSSADAVFEIGFETGSTGSRWPAQFIPLGRDADGDGWVTGDRILPAISSDAEPPINGQTPVSLITQRNGWSDPTEYDHVLIVTLSTGAEHTITLSGLTTTTTLDELAEMISIVDGDQPQLTAQLLGDRLVVRDQAEGDQPLRLQSSVSGFGFLLSEMGLVDIEPSIIRESIEVPREIKSGSLAKSNRQTNLQLGQVFGFDHPLLNGDTTEITFQSGDASNPIVLAPVTIGPLDANDEFETLLTALTVQENRLNPVSAQWVNGRIEITHGGSPTDQVPTSIDFGTGGLATALAELFPDSVDDDGDGRFISQLLTPPLRTSVVDPSTTLAAYLGTQALAEKTAAGSTVPVTLSLRDGTTENLLLRHDPEMTLRRYAEQFRVMRDGIVVVEASLQRTDSGVGRGLYRFVIVDRTTEPTGAPFSVTLDHSGGHAMSTLPIELGVIGVDANGLGRLVGASLRSTSETTRGLDVRVTRPPTLHASFAATASNIQASAAIGQLLSAEVRNGYGSFSGSLDLTVPVPAGQDFLTLQDLGNAIIHPFTSLDLDLDADLAIGGELIVDVAGLNTQPTDPNEIPRIDLVWDNILTADPRVRLQPENFSLTSENLDNLLDFSDVSVQDIIQLIGKVVEFVENVSGEDLMDKPLPLIGASLSEILNVAEDVANLIEQLQDSPGGLLNALEAEIVQMLGLEDHQFDLRLEPENRVIRIDLDLEYDVTTTRALNIDLSEIEGFETLDNFVDFEGSGVVGVEAGAALRAHLGLDVNALQGADFDDAVRVYDTSGVFAEARLYADDLNFSTSILSLDAAIIGGRVAFDRDGLNFDGGPDSTEPVGISIEAGNWPGGFKTLPNLSPSDFERHLNVAQGAALGVDLPTSILGADSQLQLQWTDLNSFVFPTQLVDTPITNQTGNALSIPDITDAISGLSLGDGIAALAAGLQGLFESIDGYLGDEILGIPVPLIGEAIADAVDFVDTFVGPMADAFNQGFDDNPQIGQQVADAIFLVLGPGVSGNGLNIIRDRNGDGSVTVADIGLPTFDGNDRRLGFDLSLGVASASRPLPIDLDLGGSVLGLDVEGDVSLEAGFVFNVGIGIDLDAGPFVTFGDGNDLAVDFYAGIDRLVAQGRLGPLDVGLTALHADDLTPDQLAASRIDPLDSSTEAINAVRGSFGINFPADTYTLANIADAFAGITVATEFVGSLHANVNTGLNTSTEGLPRITADLHVQFGAVSGGNVADVISSITSPSFSITDAGLDLGSFVADVIAPILGPVQDFLEPLQPTIDKLTQPIPVLSDIIGPTTFVDLIGAFGSGGETVAEFVNAIISVNDAIVGLPLSADGLILPLGNFSVSTNANGDAVVTEDASSPGVNFDDYLAQAEQATNESAEYLRNLPRQTTNISSGGSTTTQPGKFRFPIFEDPASAIGLLFGNDVDLVKFQAPTLEAEFGFNIGVPVFPGFQITFGGQFNAIIDFAFGYDTQGIRKFAETGQGVDLLDGFYLDDYRQVGIDENEDPIYADRPEMTFRFAVTAGGEINLAVAKAGVEAELGAALLLDLNDPDLDGKVRLSELNENIQLGNAPALGPLWIFDASGQLDVALTAYAKAFGIRVQARLGPKVLVNYEFPRPEPANPILGRLTDDGTLIVHVGPESSERQDGDLSDGDDVIFVSTNEDNGKTVITGFGTDQEFSGVTRVWIDAGEGDDEIFIEENFVLPVTVHGGYGDDDITGGAGPLTAYGGQGDDTIFGGAGNDLLIGEGTGMPDWRTITPPGQSAVTFYYSDNDLIDGGAGNDTIFGSQGNDQLQGNAGNDRIHGEDGDDYLGGNAGNDILFGGDGDDILSGDAGNDILHGESEDGTGIGRDFLQGGEGDDVLRGGAENDELFGGAGSDDLFGGDGDDLLVGAVTTRDNPDFATLQPVADVGAHTFDGGAGNDVIHGTAGIDVVTDISGITRVFTYESNDRVTTGDQSDQIWTGSGDDVVDAGNGANVIFTGSGFDIVDAGDGNDLIDLRPPAKVSSASQRSGSQVTDRGGDNRILGDAGDDIIDVLGSGSNYINVGDGNNLVTTLGGGDDTILTGAGDDIVDAGDGNNEVSVGVGNDRVTTGRGNDNVYLGSGDDWASTGDGDDVVIAGDGNDFVDAGSGSDLVRGGDGDDEIVGGIGSDTLRGDAGVDVIWGGLRIYQRSALLVSLVTPNDYVASDSAIEFPPLVPAITVGGPLEGSLADGDDWIIGGDGRDFLFGGGGRDRIESGGGDGYIDGGRGADVLIGSPGSDVIRGGDGDDRIEAGAGIDFSYGDGGDDFVLGGAGIDVLGVHETYGQRAYGGDGNDVLWAYAPTKLMHEVSLRGEYLDGGQGRDELLGNLRQDTLIGGGGDDRLLGDALAGSNYARNDDFRTFGGDDLLVGGFGDDLLQGGGGNDVLFGGANVDELEGHDGDDRLYGGHGIDFLRLDVAVEYGDDLDVMDGGFADTPDESPFGLDNSTDIIVINGSDQDDVITIAGNGDQAIVNYQIGDQPLRQIDIRIQDSDGNTLVEQYQINGLGGNDTIGFEASFDTSDLAARSRDWVGVFQGGSGDDTLTGSAGRDRLDGGPGSDEVFGLGGDDRLWGDSGNGMSIDEDHLYAGGGNDDLIGGLGVNYLFAWSSDPTGDGTHLSGPDYGVFDENGTREDTGLNRMLGRDQDDFLFAGTGLDFMYGGAGDDTLHDVDGQPLENFGVPAGDEWLEYARNNDSVWYYGGTERDDIISVDFVTEPGLLGNHHLITRLTENNGFFSFDAQVRLDFAATNPDGSLVWDPSDLVHSVEEIRNAVDDDARRLAARTLELSGDLLPPEGDFTAIIVNAGGGDDQVFVGPTVQKTVWTAAGEGDDIVEYSAGTAILVDIADADPRNDVFGGVDDFSQAYELSDSEAGDPSRLGETAYFTNLTLDSPTDVDWFTFVSDGMTPAEQLRIVVDSLSAEDHIEVELYEHVEDEGINELALLGTLETQVATLDPTRPSRTSLTRNTASYPVGQRVYIRVRSGNGSPTSYNLGIDLGGDTALGVARIQLGSQSDTFLRRDVIVGGPGDDILRGGPSEDWVIGGDGDDIITGGVDGAASDILIGGDGNDVFQIIPSEVGELELTLADELEGGEGYDRVLFLGGDIDEQGRPVPDFVTLRYQPLLNTWEMAAKVWDTANQRFETVGNEFVIHSASYRARQIEATEFDTRSGADQVRLDEASYSILGDDVVNVSGFQFDLLDGSNDERQTYGISPGDRQVGGAVANFILRGGAGNDLLIGSPYGDVILGGGGLDQIIGGGGNDNLQGDAGNDLIVGDMIASPEFVWDRLEVVAGQDQFNDAPAFATPVQFENNSLQNLTLHDGDGGDWYVIPASAASDPLTANELIVDFDEFEMQGVWSDINRATGRGGPEVIPALVDLETGNYTPTAGQPDVFLIGINNPVGQMIVARSAPRLDLIGPGNTVTARFLLDISGQPTLTVGVDVSSGQAGGSIAADLNAELQNLGLGSDVRAHYHTTRARLVLVSLKDRPMTVRSADIFSFAYLGFEDGQVPQQLPYGLGGYQISVVDNEILTQPTSGPSLPSQRLEYQTADRSALQLAPSQAVGLNDAAFAVETAAKIEGGRRDEMIGEVISLGDINADGRNDFVIPGATRAYVFLGHVDPNFLFGDQSDIRDAADYILNYPQTGSVEWLNGPVDVDGDGFDDLTYAVTRFTDLARTEGTTSVNMISGSNLTQNSSQLFAIPMGGFEYQDLDHQFDLFGKQLASLDRTLDVPIQAAWIRFNQDEFADLAVFSQEPSIRHGITSVNYGGVLDGKKIHEQVINNTTGNKDYLILIGSGIEDATTVAESHFDNPASVTHTGSSPEAFFDFGDVDGDGLDDVVTTVPRGWEYSTNGNNDPEVVISRTYLHKGGSFGFGYQLTSPILQLAADTAGLRDPNHPELGNQGALNAELPVVVSDLNNDGFADVIAISDLADPGDGSGALLIYTGQELTGDNNFAAREAAVTFAPLPGSRRTLLDARVAIGDFDGNGEQDLGFSVSGSSLAGTHIFYDAIDGGSLRSIDSNVERLTSVTSISAPTGSNNFGLAGGNAIDLNGDRIDDLILADPPATTSAGDLGGGILYVVPGSQRRVPLPDESLVVSLSNDSIRGIGDVARDSQGLLQVDSTLASDIETDWYRFRTVGDGNVGDSIRLTPDILGTDSATQGASGIIRGSDAFDNVPSVVIDSGQSGVYEIDLSRLLARFDDPASIDIAELRLRGSATATTVDSSLPLSYPEELTAVPAGNGFGDRVFFVAAKDDEDSELFVTDGTAAGTRLAYETIPGPESANPSYLTPIGDRLVFATSVYELLQESSTVNFFVTDGTETKPVGNPDQLNLQPYSDLIELDGDLYFNAIEQRTYSAVLAVIRFESDGSTELSVIERSGQLPFAATSNALFLKDGGELSVLKAGQTSPTTLSDQFGRIPDGHFSTTSSGELIFAASDKSSGRFGVYVTDGSRIDPLHESSDDSIDLAYGFQTTDSGVYFLIQSTVYFYDGSSVEAISQIDVPMATKGNAMFRTFTDGSNLVTVGNNGESELRLTTIDQDGNRVAESSVKSDRYVFLTDAIMDGDELLLGTQSQEQAFGEVKVSLSTFHVTNSTVKQVREFVETPQTSGVFEQMTVSGGVVVMEGYRTDNVFGGRLWAADVPDKSASPIEVNLNGGGPATATVKIQIAGGRNDLVITGDELAEDVVIQRTLTVHDTSALQIVDLTSDIERFRYLFEQGYRSLVVQLSFTDGEAAFEPMNSSSDTGLFLGDTGLGVSGQLIDSTGRMIAEDFQHLDLRNLLAGEYLIGVSRIADSIATRTSYQLEIDSPRLGDAHDLPADDLLHGGDGDDVVIGGHGKDRIHGDSGDDTLVGELFELRDAVSNDAIASPLPEERFSDSRSPLQRRDPRIVIGISAVDLGPGEVSLSEPALAAAIAEQLGTQVISLPGGDQAFATTVHASDLGSITQMDLSNLGLKSLEGLEYLVGLIFLDLSGNELEVDAIEDLAPGDFGATGVTRLAYLNLDRNHIQSVSPLSQLLSLRALSIADQSEGALSDLSPLEDLTELVYLNVSGNKVADLDAIRSLSQLRILDVSGQTLGTNNVAAIDVGTLTTMAGTDASIANATGPWQVVNDPAANGGTYLVLDTTSLNGNERVDLSVDGLAENVEYEVFARWHGDASHTENAIYSIAGKDIAVNQRAASVGTQDGLGPQWQSLGVFRPDDGSITAVISPGVEGGLLTADALVVRPVDGALGDHLVHLDVRGTTLTSHGRELLLTAFDDRGGVLHQDASASPIYIGPTALTLGDGDGFARSYSLNDFFRDTPVGPLVFTMQSTNDSDLRATINGNQLEIETNGAVGRIFSMELTATNASGASTTVSLPIVGGFGLAQGQVKDTSGRPTEGVRVHVANLAGYEAVTDSRGRFNLLTPTDEVEISLVGGQNVGVIQSPTVYVEDIDVPLVLGDVNFLYAPAIQLSSPSSALEGDTMDVEVDLQLEGDLTWTVSGGPVRDESGDANGFRFTPLDEGVYTVSATVTANGNREFVSFAVIRVEEVKSVLQVGDDLVISEGQLDLTRQLVQDPGSDAVTIVVDYGNGDVQRFEHASNRLFEMQTFYSSEGLYTVTVAMTADGSTVTDSFDVTVQDSVPQLSVTSLPEFTQNREGGELNVSIVDLAGTLNRTTWSYSVDWGDETSAQDFAEVVDVSLGSVSATAMLTHQYFEEGIYNATVHIIDADGRTLEQVIEIVVVNDAPLIQTSLPSTVLEDGVFLASTVIADSDLVEVLWDFGDGTALRSGTNVNHQYGRPGEYMVTLTATDFGDPNDPDDDLVRVEVYDIEATAVNDAPVFVPTPTVRVVETFDLVLPIIATDEDGDALTYSLSGAPDGVTMDADGVIRWTPTVSQGSATYTFEVELSDGIASVVRPVTIEVLDTGSISGELFVDQDSNGRRENSEPALLDRMVMIDEGDDGTFEHTLSVDADGRFQFSHLPIGLYRVVADFGDEVGISTPRSFLVDMTTTNHVSLTPIGFNDDIDHDGIRNDLEINSLAGSDANQDGILDYLQSHVASIETAGGMVTLISGVGTQLSNIAAQKPLRSETVEGMFPLGRILFSVEGLPPGANATVELITPGDAAINLIYTVNDLVDPLDPYFAEFGNAAEESVDFLADRVRLTGRDGGEGDIDEDDNGILAFSLQPASVDPVWTNPDDAYDVNNDGKTTALDALLVINALTRGSGEFDLDGPRPHDANFFDVNGDGRISALDALQVINQLSGRESIRNEAEGERVPDVGASAQPLILSNIPDEEDVEDSTLPGQLF
ncbi:Alkaline phosphatase [Rhodopirellula islandica]|uniref:Alkaline phosphatase n=1 Tax=Rhodopirellula islandica TaxID=595434 RepID=A0A0J1EL52_RHOIS|nr:dockerin type I domain-containing protein [Rhodopirellula islandica]KLU06274.1 Alkaline phosphatase [Rhodopirellula islandica]